MLEYTDLRGLGASKYFSVGTELHNDGACARLLPRLVNATGVTIYTSPANAYYWAIASSAVSIICIPEFEEFKERITYEEWAAHMENVPNSSVSALIKRKSAPVRGKLVRYWEDYQQRLLQILSDVSQATPLNDGPRVELVVPTNFNNPPTIAALDWEWVKNRPEESVGLAISDAENNYYLPVRASDTPYLPDSEGAARQVFANYLESGLPVVLHGGRADISTQYSKDPIELVGKPIHDTLLMAYILDSNIPDLSLKLMAPLFLNERAIPYPGNTEDLDAETGGAYAAGSDTRLTWKLWHKLRSELVSENLWKVYDNIERPLVPIVSSMEKVGVPVDIPTVVKSYKQHVAIEYGVRRFFEENYGPIDTATKARQTLSKILGFDPGTTDQRKITKHRNGEIDLYLLFTTTRTRRRNFLGRILREWKDAGKPSHFYLHPRFNQAGGDDSSGRVARRAPRTGRFSSSNPNFQQQPRTLRGIYVPPAGMKWWKWDYGQIELRLAANASMDKNLIADILSGQPHVKFQREIEAAVNMAVDYYMAKTANFEKLYFGGDRQLVQVLQKDRVYISLELARAIGKVHADRYGSWYGYAENYIYEVKRNGYYATTPSGRRRKILELRSRDPETYAHGKRAAVNHGIQGWAADIIKMTIARITPILKDYGAHLALTVHDELDGWVPEGADLAAFSRDMIEAMTDWNVGTVPLVVDGGIGDSWAGPFK